MKEIPKTFIPNKKYDFKEKEIPKKIQKQEIKNIRDLILSLEEVGGDYEDDHRGSFSEEDFREHYGRIKFKDVKENRYGWYAKGLNEDITEAEELIGFYVLEYKTSDLLLKRLEKIYEEAILEESRGPNNISRALIVDKYVLIIYGYKSDEQDLYNMENIYRERFGAKRLIKKIQFELE